MKLVISIVISVSIHALILFRSSSTIVSSRSENALASSFRIRTLIEFENKKLDNLISSKESFKEVARKSKETISKVNSYLTKVRRIIERLKFKNTKATKLKLKGRVKLAFKIDSMGKIIDVSILKSSRIAAIDKSALRTLSRVKILPKPPSEIAGRGESIVFSIIYE